VASSIIRWTNELFADDDQDAAPSSSVKLMAEKLSLAKDERSAFIKSGFGIPRGIVLLPSSAFCKRFQELFKPVNGSGLTRTCCNRLSTTMIVETLLKRRSLLFVSN
jgi:hypothetical protein